MFLERLPEFVSNHLLLVSAFVAILAMIAFTEWRRAKSGAKNIAPSTAINLVNHEDAVMLDVREQSEFKGGHIINAIHIPLSKLGNEIDRLSKHKDKPVIAYCRSGSRSVGACSTLKQHGFENVHNLGGGLAAWQNAGLPVTQK